MSSKEIGIESARKVLGNLVDDVHRTGQPLTLTRGNSRRPIARVAPLETPQACDVCGHQHLRPIVQAQHGMCSQCHKRVKHIDDGTGHNLCDSWTTLPGILERRGDTAPGCPACTHTADTGEDPIRIADIRLLGHAAVRAPMYDHWTTEGYRQTFREAAYGRRLARDGYLDLTGEHPTPTGRGVELLAAYLHPQERTGGSHYLDVAAALRAIA